MKKNCYQAIWQTIFEHTDRDAQDVTLLVDFEQASYLAAEAEFMGINIGGCSFHFKQAMHRHVQELGLATKYNED
jgi:hypothetical protein